MQNDEDKGNSIPGSSIGQEATVGDGRPILQYAITGSSPPKFVSFEDIVKAADGMKNMTLAHEIAVDKNFQLQKLEPENDSLHKRVKEVMHNAFWNLLSEQLDDDPPNYEQALILLKEVKESLCDLILPHHIKIRENINEILDIDLIKQQAEKGVLDFQHYANYVISVMSKLCAPIRDEKIHELSKTTNVIATFKGIMEVLQLMRLDLANFTITMMRPNIVASSIEYERAKFADFLTIQSDGLKYTREWLLKNLDLDKTVAFENDPNVIKQTTHCLLVEAYLDLLEWDFSPDAETLMLDQGRFLQLRDKTSVLSIVGSVLLICINTVPQIQGLQAFKEDVKRHLAIILDTVHSTKDLEKVIPNIVVQVKTDVKQVLENIGAIEAFTPDIESSLEGQICQLVQPDHKIRHLVSLRIRQFLQKILFEQSVKPQQIPPGLSSLQPELTEIAAQFLILITHNRNVFGEYYQQIVTEALDNRRANTVDEDKNATNSKSS